MRRILCIAAAVALLGVSSMCSAQMLEGDEVWTAADARTEATPSWYGETGLVVIPTATIVDPQTIQAHFHRVDRDSSGWENTWGVNVGLTANIEGGVTRLDAIGETIFQAKINLDLKDWFGLEDAPDVAIGCRDIGDDVDRALYVVLSQDLLLIEDKPAILVAHLGFGDTSLPGSPLDGMFGGVDFVPLDFLRVQLEHDGENFNACARYWLSKWLTADVGWLDESFGWGVMAQTKF